VTETSTVRAQVILEAEAQAFADAVAQPPFLFQLGPGRGRMALDEVQSGWVSKPDVDVQEMYAAHGTARVPVRVVRPRHAAAPLAVVLYVHGAGWVFGDAFTHDRLVREIAVGVDAAVVFADYSRSPEAKYPRALEEVYTAAQWIACEGPAFGLDPERVAIAGDSVGGNMATAVALLAKARGGPAFVHELLFYPATDATFETPSYHQFAEGFHLRRDAMQWYWDQYVDGATRCEITASPLRASRSELAGLPPTTVITAEADVLRDEGEAYAAKLRAAGVAVTAARFDGTIHDFVMLNALAETNAARGAMRLAMAELRAALRCPATTQEHLNNEGVTS
jgi:acetyl esterase